MAGGGGALVFVAVCVVIAAVGRLSFLAEPFWNDAGIYIYMGKVLLTGGTLYRDYYETKLPTVALVTAPLFAVFRNVWFPYILFQLALGVIGPFVLARAARRSIGEYAFLPVLLAGLTLLNVSRFVLGGFQLETIQAFLAILAASCILRSLTGDSLAASFRAGIWSALAAYTKPTGLAVAFAFAATLVFYAGDLRWRRVAHHMGLLCLGAALPIALAGVWIASAPFASEMPSLLKQISLYGSETPWEAVFQIKSLIFLLIPFSALAIRQVFVRQRPYTGLERPARMVLTFAFLWAVAEIAGVIVQRRMYAYHFLVLAPPAALLFGIPRLAPRLVPIAVGLAPSLCLSVVWTINVFNQVWPIPRDEVSEYVIAHTGPNDAVWSDRSAELLIEADRPTGSRVPHSFVFVNYDQAPLYFTNILLHDFDERRPKYIVLMVDNRARLREQLTAAPGLESEPQRLENFKKAWQTIRAYLKEHYILETKVAGRNIFRRKDNDSSFAGTTHTGR